MKLTNMHPTKLAPGTYRATHDIQVSLFHGRGTPRRIESADYSSGDVIDVPRRGNGFWTGAELLSVPEIVGAERRQGIERS